MRPKVSFYAFILVIVYWALSASKMWATYNSILYLNTSLVDTQIAPKLLLLLLLCLHAVHVTPSVQTWC